MSNYSSAAYDFDRFGGEKQEHNENNVVHLPVEHVYQNNNQVSVRTVTKWLAVFAVSFVLFGSLIFNQLTLNELNTEIRSLNTQLERSRSEYIQLEMAAASRMTLEDVEEYAVNVLGMQKMQNNQLVYIRTNDEDKIVAYDRSGDTFWGKAEAWLSELFS